MTAPTIYTHADQDGPGYENHTLHWLRILKACLVDGYPGKPAAGWSLVYDDIDIDNANATVVGTKAIFKSASGNTIWMIEPAEDTSFDATFKLSLCEQAFSDGSVTGAVSGSQSSANPGGHPLHFLGRRSAPFNWVVLATPETFILSSRDTHWTYSVNAANGWANSMTLYVGKMKDLRPGVPEKAKSIIFGGAVTSNTGSSATSNWSSTGHGVGILRGVDGGLPLGDLRCRYGFEGQSSGFQDGQQLGPVYELKEVPIICHDPEYNNVSGLSYVLIGKLYGFKTIAGGESANYHRYFLPSVDPLIQSTDNRFEKPGHLTPGDHGYISINSHNGALISLNPADWSD
ncbi:MAG: hypothetical protein LAT65_05910 [Saccharospirillum sp.]|nr:hypothetical protein [Saccharospirillum sp.]